MAFFMFWEVLWPLALGFLISAVVQTLVPREAVVRALGKDDVRGVSFATVLGAASSSCSYAAVAVARSLFRKGATLANAILFEFASTNLVFELGLVLLVLMGWQFLGAEFAGGLLMIAILAVLFRFTLRAGMVDAARAQAEKGLQGRMEGHAAMQHTMADR
ncbi:MAG TPA: permease, partial [Candidatus Dormibacteraeota bacterium]|nr:permease [Candidatus Dormibacteraeota bacterium]